MPATALATPASSISLPVVPAESPLASASRPPLSRLVGPRHVLAVGAGADSWR